MIRLQHLCLVTIVLCSALPAPAGWKAGTAKVAITPEQPTWMAGYAARKSPSEGKLHDLWAKALVLEDESGGKAAMVTLDLCGIDRLLSNQVRDALKDKHGLTRDRIVLACSHTHSGPVVSTNLITMYPLDDEQKKRVADYTNALRDTIINLVGEALKDVAPAELSWGVGHADFAVNRRNNDQGKAEELRRKINLNGPVDHDVPVLKVLSGRKIKAIVCNYACHCTTLSLNRFSGDYAGYAQIALESAHPGAQAMFVAGCGADQNPLPRGKVEQAEKYGKELADAVDVVLGRGTTPVAGPLKVAYREVDLAFAPVPDRAHWEAEVKAPELARINRAKKFLAMLDDGKPIPATYPYPVQVWRLGDGPTWVLLGGEVVVDYALRLKRNLGASDTWVSAYCNDVMAYIPSSRVLKEGGYEGGGAMVYYAQPGPWSERVEEEIVAAIAEMVAPR